MPGPENDRLPHLVLTNTSDAHAYTAYSGGSSGPPPDAPASRAVHGNALKTQIEALRPRETAAAQEYAEKDLASGLGLQIQFVGQPDIELAFESLQNEPQKIELLSIRKSGATTIANVFVPEGKLEHFEKYIRDYIADRRGVKDQSLDHKALINTIASIRAAEIQALWTDDPELLPVDTAQEIWFEVWLPIREDRQSVLADFRKLAELAECRVGSAQVEFPERTVLLIYGSIEKLSRSVLTLNCIAELRRAKDTAEFFDGMDVTEQQEWLAELQSRLVIGDEIDSTPRICVLDTGVNREHQLLASLLPATDMHTIVPAWGTNDSANHGTGIAGLAAFGDLTVAMASNDPVKVDHRLESVKLLPDDGDNEGDAHHHAYLFLEGVSRPEVSAADRRRVFTTAVTASDYRDRGRPSAWSAMVDRLASDFDGQGQDPRLFILSAGNTRDPDHWSNYPASLATNLIHDPGQSWNAITVGAFTEKVVITEADTQGYQPIAASGGLSPFTTTSATWESGWPYKPDVVFEGGNAAKDALGAVGMASLNLLTTNNEPLTRLFTTTNATSAASAQCARMAAQLMAAYPNFRAETIRALIVHSAEWTQAMRDAHLPAAPVKRDFAGLIRHCGWGQPNLAYAQWSASNSLTLVVEDSVKPYKKDGAIKTCDMNLHALPWPKEELEALQDEEVEMRVTLSYFVEPNPSARGSTSKFHYPSHRLRFDVRRPVEPIPDFLSRISAAAATADDASEAGNSRDPNWLLGEVYRHRGSIHQDVWRGTAADLASRGHIAVYPAMGWWRTRPKLNRFDLIARYSLIVSIRTRQTEIDLYNAIEQRIGVPISIPV